MNLISIYLSVDLLKLVGTLIFMFSQQVSTEYNSFVRVTVI